MDEQGIKLYSNTYTNAHVTTAAVLIVSASAPEGTASMFSNSVPEDK